eukprot:10453554-Ditylum_brightwellii.AAC.2
MASFFGSQLAILISRVFNRSITHTTLDTLIAGGDGQLLKVTHYMHVTVVLLDRLINLVLYKHVEIFDLFSAHVTLLGAPLGILNKVDLLEHLLFHDIVSGLNILLVSLIILTIFCVMVTKPMIVENILLALASMTFSWPVTSFVLQFRLAMAFSFSVSCCFVMLLLGTSYILYQQLV